MKELNRFKSKEVLEIVVRIFVKLRIKLNGKAKLEPLNQAIEMWKYEISMLDMKENNSTDKDSANPEISISEKEPPLFPGINLLYENLIGCFEDLKTIVKSKRSSTKDLVPLFSEKFGRLAGEFVDKSGDFSFLLKQRIEFAIIMIDYIFEGDWDYILEKKKIQANFETLFQNRNGDEMRKLVSSCQRNLRGLILYKGGDRGTGRFEWLGYKSKIMNNSIKRINDLLEKISHNFQTL
jgi:hypothetical protein